MSSCYCNFYESNRELIDYDHYPRYRFSWDGQKNLITIRQQYNTAPAVLEFNKSILMQSYQIFGYNG